MSGWSVEPPAAVRTEGRRPVGTRLVLIRHGEAICNVEGVVGGPKGCRGLTETGREQASALAARLVRSGELRDAAALYTSVLPRAIETASIIAPGLTSGLRATEDCDLCELHPGQADGLTWSAMVERFDVPDWDANPRAPFAPGGESLTGFFERCVSTFERIASSHKGERVVLVVHGGVIEQLMKVVTRSEPGERLGLVTVHCSITEVEFDGDRRRLLRYNDRAPFAAA